MDAQLTPQDVHERATAAHIPISRLMERAGVRDSTFWRWETGRVSSPHPVTIRKIADALAAIEAERASPTQPESAVA